MSPTLEKRVRNRVRNKVRGFLMARGTTGIKRSLWNAEFASGKWDNLAHTEEDCLYPYLERYLHGGSVLDLGCGSGNTGIELAPEAYSRYTGVDISDVAIDIAKKRTKEEGRTEKNQYFRSDMIGYEPTQQFDVILFRESIYYVSGPPLKKLLARYAQCLKQGGVFMVRLWTGTGKYSDIVEFLEANCTIIEKFVSQPSGPVVLVFR